MILLKDRLKDEVWWPQKAALGKTELVFQQELPLGALVFDLSLTAAFSTTQETTISGEGEIMATFLYTLAHVLHDIPIIGHIFTCSIKLYILRFVRL